MSKIDVGQTAPPFELPSSDGTRFSLAQAQARGPVVAAFFKVSCPTCQFTFPFLERLFESYSDDRVTFVGISQDDDADTNEFRKELEIEFPSVLDEEGFPVSNEYGITNVPTFYLIGGDGKVQVASVGFNKKALEKISAALGRFLNLAIAPVFLPCEIVPETKPG